MSVTIDQLTEQVAALDMAVATGLMTETAAKSKRRELDAAIAKLELAAEKGSQVAGEARSRASQARQEVESARAAGKVETLPADLHKPAIIRVSADVVFIVKTAKKDGTPLRAARVYLARASDPKLRYTEASFTVAAVEALASAEVQSRLSKAIDAVSMRDKVGAYRAEAVASAESAEAIDADEF